MNAMIEQLTALNLIVIMLSIPRSHRCLLWFICFSFLSFFYFQTVAFAQEVGVSISPAQLEETIDPGEVKEYTLSIKNLKSTEQTFYIFTRNISGVSPGGVPIFADDDAERTGYELADWIELPISELTIDGNGSSRFSYSMNVPEAASPGSHFGGVFISVDPPDFERSGAAVGYQVAQILSMRVSGDALEEANIRQFSTNKFLYGSQNVDFSVRIENTGNVMVRPSGPLEIYNMLGKRVDTLKFNEEKRAVLPAFSEEGRAKQQNVVDFKLSWEGDSIGFGRYEAIVTPSFGDQGSIKSISSTVSFWILPMNIIGPALAILGFILLVTFVAVRIYIKRTVAHLSQGRGARIVRSRRRKKSSGTLLLVVVMLTVTALFLIVLLALFA